MPRNVLFLCTGNSCRSQMAEAIVNHCHADRWRAVSAGTRPTGFVHPLAVAVLHEIGVDASGARSKAIDEFRGRDFDLIVTVCDAAAEECPVWLGAGARAHCGFPDPARATGTDDDIRRAFRAVRDAMFAQLRQLLISHAVPER